jgi:hypothetical protein
MRFPLWQYLKQPLWDRQRPAELNPRAYWRKYRRCYLQRCWQNAFLEDCWHVPYQAFAIHFRNFCDRRPLEEDPRWLLSRCWNLQRRDRVQRHPENRISEGDL